MLPTVQRGRRRRRGAATSATPSSARSACVGKDGKAVGTSGAPTIGVNWHRRGTGSTGSDRRRPARRADRDRGRDRRPDWPSSARLTGRRHRHACSRRPGSSRRQGRRRWSSSRTASTASAASRHVFFTTRAAQQLLHVNGYSDLVVAAKDGVSQRPAAHAHRGRAAQRHRGDHRHAAGRRAGQRHPEGPRLPQHVPAGLRGDRAVRRHVHHLQHVLDAGRAADQRELALLRALGACRRQVTRVGAAGGGRGRPDRRRPSASAPGVGAGDRAAGAVRRVRRSGCRRPALVIEPRTVIVGVRGRHRRHRGGGAHAGPAGRRRIAAGGGACGTTSATADRRWSADRSPGRRSWRCAGAVAHDLSA